MKTLKGLFATGLVAVLLVAPVAAQFSVVDVTGDALLAKQLVQLLAQVAAMGAQYAELVSIYSRLTDQYNQAVYMAKFLQTLGRYRTIPTPWQGMIGTNQSGTTAGWIQAVNSGLNVSGGWLNSTYARPGFPSLSVLIPAIQQARAQMQYGTFELQDGTAQSAITTIGSLRLHGAQNELAFNTLENDSYSENPDDNTTAALLNKINAAGMVTARAAADTNKMLVSQAEMELIRLKEEHDGEAAMTENEIAFRTTGMAVLRLQHDGLSNAMLNFVWP